MLQASSRSSSNGSHHSRHAEMTLDELRAVNRYAESTKSLSYLPQVRLTYIKRKHIKQMIPAIRYTRGKLHECELGPNGFLRQ